MNQHVTEFPALGTTVRSVVIADAHRSTAVFQRLRGFIFDFEQRFSRFLAGNELDRLNRSAGYRTIVSQEMLELLTAARTAFEVSQGMVDVTIGQAMINIGYRTSFELMAANSELLEVPPSTAVVNRAVTFDDVHIDIPNRSVTIPPQTRIDFGGIGKGYLLDRCEPMLRAVSQNFWLSLGGDLIISGQDGYDRSWPIGVQDPSALDHNTRHLQLPVGRHAIAVSGTTKRQWNTTAGQRHHIIDPRTGTSTTTDVVMAMAVTETGLLADVLAKTAVILGAEQGLAALEHPPQSAGLVVTTNGQLRTSSNLLPYLRP